VNEKTQVVLAAALAHVRDMRSAESGDIPVRIAHASGVIAGLEDTGALTSAEASEWKRRLDELSAEGDPRAREPGSGRAERLDPTAGLLRLVPGPFEAPLFDGRLRVVLLELYEDRLYLYWHIAAMPSADAILGGDIVDLNRDLDGLSPEARDEQRWIAVRTRLHTRDFALSDDLGTRFRWTRGNGGGGGDEMWGVRVFVPAVPEGASSLRLQFHDAEVRIPLK
jgi:hypothetical protein